MHISSVGIDLGKTTFHLVALGEEGKILVRKKFSRKQLLMYTGKATTRTHLSKETTHVCPCTLKQ